MARQPRRILRKQFNKNSFRLPKTATMLAQGYNAPTKKLTAWQTWRLRILGLIVILLIVIIYSPLFKINNIIVNNVSSNITRKYIQQVLQNYLSENKFYILPQNNLLLFSPPAAAERLKKDLVIEQVTFDRHYPNVLRININEQLIVGLWRVENKYYTLDKRGVVLQEVDFADLEPDLPIIKNDRADVFLSQQVIDTDDLNKLQEVIINWPQVVGGKFKEIIYKQSDLPTIYVTSYDGWQARISLQSAPIYDQLVSLQKLLQGKVKQDATKVDYIDVRFVDKAFIKYK